MKTLLKHLLPLIFLMLILSQIQIKEVKAEDWSYYKQITVSNFSADFQKKITVHYGSGTDSTDVVYLNSHCQGDFDDVQFRASDKSTVLEHWRETYVSGDWATFWVKLPSTEQTIYLYYGNGGATGGYGDPDSVFMFFDNAESGAVTDKWTESNSGDGDVEYSVEASKYGSKSLKCTQTSSSTAYYLSKAFSAKYNVIIEFWKKEGATDNYDYVILWESGNQRLTARWDDSANLMYYTDEPAQYNDTGYNYSTNWA